MGERESILFARKPVAPIIRMVLSSRKWSTLPTSILENVREEERKKSK